MCMQALVSEEAIFEVFHKCHRLLDLVEVGPAETYPAPQGIRNVCLVIIARCLCKVLLLKYRKNIYT